MSQKADTAENDLTTKNVSAPTNPTTTNTTSTSSHHHHHQQQPTMSNIPSQFMPPPPMNYPGLGNQMQQQPYYYLPDYWNNYGYGANPMQMAPQTPFDMSYREDLNKTQMFNQVLPPAPTPNKPNPTKNVPNNSSNQLKNASQLSQNASSMSSFMPQPPMPLPPPHSPYMDPYMFYAQMAAAAAAAANPYGYPPYMQNPASASSNPYAYMNMLGQHRMGLPDDQQSIQSFHFDLDTRSEKKYNITNRAQSIAGDPFNKQQNIIRNPSGNLSGVITAPGLLIQDQIQVSELNANLDNLETAQTLSESNGNVMNNIKRESENRMTPQLHQLPHVRAGFSLNGIVQIRANDPCEGQPALVDLINLSDFMENYLNTLKNKPVSKNNEIYENDEYAENDYNETDGDCMNEDIRNEILTNYKLLQEFPGPLVKENHTSKAQVIQFCLKNVKECLSNSNVNLIDPQSHALLWDYLALLVRQNGIVDLKTDVSPLLLSGIGADTQNQWSLTTRVTNNVAVKSDKQITHSASSSSLIALSTNNQADFVLVSENNDAENKRQQSGQISEEEIQLNKLRQLLGAGQKSDAIELAIKHNMWPHALFLASSFNSPVLNASTPIGSQVTNLSNQTNGSSQFSESKVLNKVKIRFINSLQSNDPILTCYQLLIGRVPSVASNVSKSEWNEWRRHLAMIVSNVDETNQDLVLTTIKTMGDSLASNGRIAASHFCYLLSNCSFGTFNKKSSKLVLIGSSHNQDFNKFCQISAIQATEIFEFANSLSSSNKNTSSSSNGLLEHFVKYKLIYASRLLEHGLVNEAYKYLEIIAKTINLNPKSHSDKISSVYQLANRLRVYDPDFCADDLNTMNNSTNNNEPQWLQELTQNYKKLYLNKLWHLLPSSGSSEPATSTDQTEPKNHNSDELQLVTAKIEPITSNHSPNIYTQQQQEHYQEENINNLNSEMNQLSLNNPNNYSTDPLSYSNQQYKTEDLQQHYQYDQSLSNQVDTTNANNANNANNNNTLLLNTQQSMPFYPQTIVQEQQINDSSGDTQSQNLNQNEPFYPINNLQQNYEPNSNIYQQTNQYYEPPNNYDQFNQQQQQHQPLQEQMQFNSYNSSRKSSITTNLIQHQQTKQRNLSSSSSTHAIGADNIYLQQHQQQQQPYQQQYNQNQGSRSRLSSTSTSVNDYNYAGNQASKAQSMTPFVPFNPNMSSQFYDPSKTQQPQQFQNIPKSQTFPPPGDNQQIREEETNFSDRQNRANNHNYEDDDDLSVANPKPSKGNNNSNNSEDQKDVKDNDDLKSGLQEQQNQGGWFKKAFGLIKTTNAPKKMILPDDKKKTIVWDDKLKKYVNKDGSEEATSTVKPPPTFLPPSQPTQQQQLQPQSQPNDPNLNRFSLKSANSKRTNYYSKLDIMASQTKKISDQQQVVSPMLSNLPPPSQLPPRFFVPEPAQLSQQTPDSNVNQETKNLYYNNNPNGYQAQNDHENNSSNESRATSNETSMFNNGSSQASSNDSVNNNNYNYSQLQQQQYYYSPQEQQQQQDQYNQQYYSNTNI